MIGVPNKASRPQSGNRVIYMMARRPIGDLYEV